jgi:hypothetical protein
MDQFQSSKRAIVFQHRAIQLQRARHARDCVALKLSEVKSVQLRLEAFNVFNHAQFFGPQAVDGNISSGTFGQVVSAAAPRLVQLGAKFTF